MKKTALITLAALMLPGLSGARIWTSADGSKTFEGDFVSCNDQNITVKRGTREMTFKMELLSEEDQDWAKAESKRLAAAEADKERAAEFADSELGKAFKDLQKLEGDRFQDYELEKAPKFFLIYYTASW